LIQATKKKGKKSFYFLNAISLLKNSQKNNYQQEDYQNEDDNILALLKPLTIHIGRKNGRLSR
jgi:hypothetical protein